VQASFSFVYRNISLIDQWFGRLTILVSRAS